MKKQPVGIQSIGVKFPSGLRTNDYWRQYYPELIEQAEQKAFAKTFSPVESIENEQELDIWTREMLPYLSDPFRGVVERRVLVPGETSLDLEYGAAMDALNAAKMTPKDVDLAIVSTMFPEQVTPGNASFLAGKLGLRCGAWNLESTCASPVVALQTASALVRSGEYDNVLVVLSATFSRCADDSSTLSFFLGDGAAAFVVGSLAENQGLISTKIIHTAEESAAFYNEFTLDRDGNPRIYLRARKYANKWFRDEFEKCCRICSSDAFTSAGVTIDNIDFVVPNTNTPWYVRVYAKTLGIELERTISMNSTYGNISAPSSIVNLYHAVHSGKIRENDLVLMCNFGGTSNAGACVMRWGNVALGPLPDAPTTINTFFGDKHKSLFQPSVVLA